MGADGGEFEAALPGAVEPRPTRRTMLRWGAVGAAGTGLVARSLAALGDTPDGARGDTPDGARGDTTAGGGAANDVSRENARAGSTAWLLQPDTASAASRTAGPPLAPTPNGPLDRATQIVGYTNLQSVQHGESLTIHLSSKIGAADLHVFRMGWYGGAGARLMTSIPNVAAVDRGVPAPLSGTRTIVCSWPASATLTTGADWTSGAYLITVCPHGSDYPSSYIPFVVRADESGAGIVFVVPSANWQAYNNWGGKNLYDVSSTNSQRAYEVSYDRPYEKYGAAEYFEGGTDAMVRFLEREGYDVTYIDSVDLHHANVLTGTRRVLVTAYHDEYWSKAMRDNLEAALAGGGRSALFLGANSTYWQVKYKPAADGRADRVIACSKDATLDPETVRFRDPPISRPESQLMGSMYEYYISFGTSTSWTVRNAQHWAYASTGLGEGATIAGLVGYEWDRTDAASRALAGITVLSASRFSANANWLHEAAIVERPNGSLVFNAASCYWPWFLDQSASPLANKNRRVEPAVQQITRNLLARALGQPLPPTTTQPATTTTTTTSTTIPPSPPKGFVAVPAVRAVDTRPGKVPLAAAAVLTVPVLGSFGIPATGVGAVVVNLTVTNPTAGTYVTVWPAGQAKPLTSNLNAAARQTAANLVIVPTGVNGAIALQHAFGSADVIVDVLGWLPATSFRAIGPTRYLDTRQGTAMLRIGLARQVAVGGQLGCPATGVAAVVSNLTLTDPVSRTYLTVWPGGATQPPTSNVNAAGGETVANLALAAFGSDGSLSLASGTADTHAIVDVLGWLPVGEGYAPVEAARLLDTRSPAAPLRNGAPRTITVAPGGIRNGVAARAAVVNLTLTDVTATTYLTAWPSDQAMPGTSSVNAAPGQTKANLAIVALSPAGTFDLANAFGESHAVVDLVGVFTG